jgi:hypothetical protein
VLYCVQELQQKHVILTGAHAGCLASKLYHGSSAYVMLAESTPTSMHKSLPAPLVLESCRAIYTCGLSPKFDAARPYLLQDQLVTHASCIPGLSRTSHGVEAKHMSDTTGWGVAKCLDNVVQHPTHSVELHGLTFSIAQGMFRCASSATE